MKNSQRILVFSKRLAAICDQLTRADQKTIWQFGNASSVASRPAFSRVALHFGRGALRDPPRYLMILLATGSTFAMHAHIPLLAEYT